MLFIIGNVSLRICWDKYLVSLWSTNAKGGHKLKDIVLQLYTSTVSNSANKGAIASSAYTWTLDTLSCMGEYPFNSLKMFWQRKAATKAKTPELILHFRTADTPRRAWHIVRCIPSELLTPLPRKRIGKRNKPLSLTGYLLSLIPSSSAGSMHASNKSSTNYRDLQISIWKPISIADHNS